MQNSKILSMLGLATKAGKTASGEETVVAEMQKRRAEIVFVSEEASLNTRNKLKNKGDFYGIPVVICFSKEELGKATGKETRTVVAVLDKGFAGAIDKLIKTDHDHAEV
ncbi:MAG: ribosomal L7Ae/L30e/S12e/Gadd45 family protein [Lachnospiraceae bacterium]|nr:ribosomal L7Ae/L30e/S12e/Gadd45 family protein [Lachnospiraceae bacterium]